MDLYRQYLVVGGMPQAVAQFVESHNLREVDAAKRDILALYRSDIHSSDDRMEIDFLVSKPGLTRMHNIIPIEVKSNREYSSVSLGKFRRKYSDTLHTPVVLHPKDLKTEDGILHLPLYMTPLSAEA